MTRYYGKVSNIGIQKLQPSYGTYTSPFSACIGINIQQPTVQAGIGAAGMALVIGLAAGAIYFATKRPK